MSLEIPNLDDKTFEELFEEARARIPRYSSQWTDHNFSDPGITFIDLFAWLAEMQIYSTDRITIRHKQKFLRLLEMYRLPACSSSAHIRLKLKDDTAAAVVIPAGALLFAADNLTGLFEPFETMKPITVSSASIGTLKKDTSEDFSGIVYLQGEDWVVVPRDIPSENGYFEPFSQTVPTQGRMLIGLNNSVIAEPLTIKFRLIGSAIPTVKHYPSVNLRWETWNGSTWQLLTVDDETNGLNQNGYVTVSGMENSKKSSLHVLPGCEKAPCTSELSWISVSPSGNEEDCYEVPPRIHAIRLHSVPVTHGRTWNNEHHDGTGLPFQTVTLKNTPVLEKTIRLRIKKIRLSVNGTEWTETADFSSSNKDDRHFRFDNDRKTLYFNDKKEDCLPDETDRDVVLNMTTRNIFDSSGLPLQQLRLESGVIADETLRVFVDDREWKKVSDFKGSGPEDLHYRFESDIDMLFFGDGEHGRIPPYGKEVIKAFSTDELTHCAPDIRLKNIPKSVGNVNVSRIALEITTEPWHEANDLDASGPGDKHFVVDYDNSTLKFGDGEYGGVPPFGIENIIVESYRSGGGVRGNIAAHKIVRFDDPEYGQRIEVTGSTKATGGTEAEDVDTAIDRARRERKNPTRLISETDIAKLARKTPGTLIHSTKVLFGFHPCYRSISMPGTVTLVVVPKPQYPRLAPPVRPSAGFVSRIRHFLSDKRLITTDLHVTGPEYIPVAVSAKVVIQARLNAASMKKHVENVLNDFINPFIGGAENKGWDLGYSVYISDLVALIQAIEGVTSVRELFMSSTAGRVKEDRILLSKIGAPYSSGHFITIITD